MEIYVCLHILFFFSLLFEIKSSLKTKKRVMLMWCIVITLFSGLRWGIGPDWEQYYNHFQRSDWGNIFNYDRYENGTHKLEPGFVFINVFTKLFFGKYYWFNLLVSIFMQFTFYKFSICFSPRRPLMMFLFLTIARGTGYFAVRSGIALIFIFWAFRYVKERNLKKYLLSVGLATLIHTQAIIFFPVYFLGRLKINLKIGLLLFFISACLGYIVRDYIQILAIVMGNSGEVGSYLTVYTSSQTLNYDDVTLSLSTIGLNLFFLIVFFWLRKIRNLRTDYFYTVLLYCFLINISFIMVFREGGMGDLTRLSSLFYPATIILIIDSVNYLTNENANRILKYFALLFFIAYTLYKLPDAWTGVWFDDFYCPYKTIFDYNYIR